MNEMSNAPQSMTRTKIGALVAAAVLALSVTGCNLASSDAASGGHHHHHDKSTSNGHTHKSPQAKPTPHYTTSQENAIRSAQQYLGLGGGFSRAGLIQQLSSQAGEGFPMADAVFAVNHIKVDYDQQAVLAAKNYLKLSGFSRSGLIQQLTSSSGDGYTLAQATYAANKVGLH